MKLSTETDPAVPTAAEVDGGIEISRSVLTPWLTYPGDVRRGFTLDSGHDRIIGPLEGRFLVAHEAIFADGKTRVRFRVVYDEGHAVSYEPSPESLRDLVRHLKPRKGQR